jgi:hypothetical protein
MMTARPDLGFCVSGIAPDGYIVSLDSEGAAREAGLLDGDVIVSLDGRPQGKPIKVAYQRRGMTLRGNVVVDLFDAPAVSVPVDAAPAAPVKADDVLAAAVPHDGAPAASGASAALIPADGDVLPSQLSSDNANELALTFGRPIGDQSWRYGRRGCVSDYGGCTMSPTPIGHADNWGDVDNWRTSTSPQAPHVRGRDWYDK